MARRRTSYRPRRASGGYRRTSSVSRRPAVRRSYSGRYQRPTTQRVEIVHVMGPGGPVGMLGHSPAGTMGVAVAPVKGKGKTF